MEKTMDFRPSISTNEKAPYHCGKVPSHIHPNDYACLEKKESNFSLSLLSIAAINFDESAINSPSFYSLQLNYNIKNHNCLVLRFFQYS